MSKRSVEATIRSALLRSYSTELVAHAGYLLTTVFGALTSIDLEDQIND